MRFFQHLSRNINRWLARRQWRIFWLTLPAVLAGLTLAVVAGIILNRHANELERHYDQLAKISLATHQFEQGRVACLRGLAGATNERDRSRWLFYLAVALNGLGQKQAALGLVNEAAPLDRPGMGSVEAHLMVAQSLLGNTNISTEAIIASRLDSTNMVAVSLHLAEQHLLSALALEPESLEVNEALGRFYINTQQPAKAQEHLMKIYAAKPDTALLLAFASDLQNDAAGAFQWADRALTAFEDNLTKSAPNYNPADRLGLVRAMMIKGKYSIMAPNSGKGLTVITNSTPEDSPEIWLGIVRNLLINGKYGSALETLDRLAQQPHAGTNSAYREPLAEVCGMVANGIAPDTKGGASARLQLIQKGLTNSPNNLQLQFLLVQAAHSPDASGIEAKAMLDERLAEATGQSAALWHYMLARDADLKGDKVAVRKELEAANQLAQDPPEIRNNLAYFYQASTNQEDWVRGLKLIQSAIDQYPYVPLFRGTRGLIMAKLGRYREAADDLEYAIPRIPDATDDRQVLAKVNAALGIVQQIDPSERLRPVRDLMGEGNYAAALQSLEQTMLVDTNPAYASAMAEVCATWVENLTMGQHAERLRLIQKGLSEDPQHPKLQAQLLEVSHLGDETGLAARKLLDQLVAKATGDAAANWHLLLGQDARQRGDLAAARKHLEAALALAPRQTQIQVELAAVLAAGNQEDLKRGLELIQPVVDEFAESADFRSIRGRILAGLGRNNEAEGDLNFAAPRLTDPTEIAETRRILARVYDALGKPKLAEEQRRLAGNPGGQ